MILDQLRRARAVGTPLIAITTADQPALLEQLASMNGKTAIISWDIIRGYKPLNDLGARALAPLAAENGGQAVTNLIDALDLAIKFPEAGEQFPGGTMIIVQNGHRYLTPDIQPIQALMNLRNDFKATRRNIVLLGPDFMLPPELTHDVLILDDPLPTPEAIRGVLSDLYGENDITHTPELLDEATGALRGLAAFPVEQAAALSITPDKTIDKLELWHRKRKMIEQVRGLTMENPSAGFDSIGGNEAIKNFAKRIGEGSRRPRVVVLVEEIEKSSAAAGKQDTSGVSQDQLQTWLTNMVDQDATGPIFVGPAGTGKTAAARAIAAELGLPLLNVDFNAAKGSLVGESEQRTRAIWKAIAAIAGKGGALVIATSNSVDNLPPALQSRFWLGCWFFDLPNSDERQAIGAIHAKRLGIEDSPAFWAKCDGWSGRNIFACCETAKALSIDLEHAALEYIIPAAEQDNTIDKLRTQANGRYLSAAYPGKYQSARPAIDVAKPKTRKIAELRTEIHEVEEAGSADNDPPVIAKPQIDDNEIEALAKKANGGKK